MYHVEWLQAVLDDLALIWMQADAVLRQSITTACHQIDQRLEFNPLDEGESRVGDARFLFESPLTISFHVVAAKRLVVVDEIRLYRKLKK